ncbi:hypothetical protein [Haloechinothrix sp. LS1_15]|uniref:hypothetical protein n=1 Tax=Haloechinothrix sp. LS1_15 TaxID=2652248 RepID=UPI0029440EF0|nr:hypothetical protein [Haloechinothrix sp. LS1_15]MDV6014241.1 hypothetical protein [Haloechinothrix sp. LS1_15]
MPRTVLPRRGRLLRRHWILAFLVGELIGFVPPAVAGAALVAIAAAPIGLVAGLTVAGAVEGTVLGIAQAWVLRAHAPAVNRRRWIVVTTAAAGYAWLVGMVIGTYGPDSPLPPAIFVVLAVLAGVSALLAMGAGQWLVLRRAVAGAGRWVWVTAGAWLVGVMIPVGALSILPDGWPLAGHVAVAIVSAVLMGVTVGALTGRTLARLVYGTARRRTRRVRQSPEETNGC